MKESIQQFILNAQQIGVQEFSLSFKLSNPKVESVDTREELTRLSIARAEADKIKEARDASAEELVKPLSTLDQMTDQEILYYATPYYDELQAQKEAHAQKIAEEKI